MNIVVLICVLIPVLALIIFIIRRNIKDKNELEEYIQHDYPGATDKKTDVDIEEKTH